MKELTKEHRNNLALLRDFLMTNDVPFDMSFWRTNPDADANDNYLLEVTKDQVDKGATGCGTAGCAAGWAPFILPALENEFYTRHDGEKALCMNTYLHRVFGIQAGMGDELYRAFFQGEWALVDNTRQGAAYRINCYLEDGELLSMEERPYGGNDCTLWDDDEKFRRDEWVSAWEQAYGAPSETPIK